MLPLVAHVTFQLSSIADPRLLVERHVLHWTNHTETCSLVAVYTRSEAEGSANFNAKMVMTMNTMMTMTHMATHGLAYALSQYNDHGGAIWRMTKHRI